jgi:homoserine O-acetyltransferase
MSALLTYRSRDSFESRFGRKPQLTQTSKNGTLTPPPSPKLSPHADDVVALHNDGLRNAKPRAGTETPTSQKPPIFSAQSYLRYQGDKFTARFDANCYIHITRKLDTHDIARGRRVPDADDTGSIAKVLSTLPPRALVISIATDGLFTTSEQREIAAHIPQAELVVVIASPDGHDGFLLEFEQINTHILRYLKREFPEFYGKEGVHEEVEEGFEIKKTSVFGEAEVDIASW